MGNVRARALNSFLRLRDRVVYYKLFMGVTVIRIYFEFSVLMYGYKDLYP